MEVEYACVIKGTYRQTYVGGKRINKDCNVIEQLQKSILMLSYGNK